MTVAIALAEVPCGVNLPSNRPGLHRLGIDGYR